MKKPPSASVRPPTQTTQRVPMRSSKPGWACAAGAATEISGIGGGAAGVGGGAVSLIASMPLAFAADAMGGVSCAGSGGGIARVAAADDANASIESSRVRSAAV